MAPDGRTFAAADRVYSSTVNGQCQLGSGTMLAMLTTSEHARRARAELDAIAAALRLNELEQLVVLGRRLLEQDAKRSSDPFGGPRSSADVRR